MFLEFLPCILTNNISNGKISRRPASISKVRISFENQENMPKFPVGPTSSRPGPILLKVAATAVKFVIRLKSSKAIRNMRMQKSAYIQ